MFDTQHYFESHPLPVDPIPFGRTGWLVSPVGFGGYRIHDREIEHREALRLALSFGCNLIDTSSNYTNGGSELLVGQVIHELISKGEITREQIIIVTKAGYVDGDRLTIAQRRIAEGSPYPEMVELSDDLWHCISPEFIADQLEQSLRRLGLKKIDVFLLHNPEYFLKAGGHHHEYYQRIKKAFEYLETQVDQGKIQYYGISSNTFPSPKDDPDYTSFETTLEIAKQIRLDHHYAVIQFPLNLLEPAAALEPNNSGKTLLELAQSEGVATLINRPLNALSEKRLVRLADFSTQPIEQATQALQNALNEAMTLEAQYTGTIPFKNFAWGHLIHHHFNTLAQLETWKNVLTHQARPSLLSLSNQQQTAAQDPNFPLWLNRYIPAAERLFEAMTDYIHSIAQSDSTILQENITQSAPELLSSFSLASKVVRLYRSLPGVTSILVGMRTPSYVRDLLDLAPPISATSAIRALKNAQKPGEHFHPHPH